MNSKNEKDKEINRLYWENIIWVIFIGLSLLNILGDNEEISFLKLNDISSKDRANKVFELTLTITFFIYIYFFTRNFKQLQKVSADKKWLYEIKLAGSIFLIVGILLLIYFQKKQVSFIGSPAL